ncbi:MAG TPA: HAD-IA family hydrolase [Thermoanaerobaculia bacterium]|nr:HAD-IA family hydrolase [Thermoanaerobaculia bacterium]
MNSKLRYRAVLFDLDGTLVDSYSALADAVNYARRHHGLDDLPPARIREFVGDGLETLLQRAFERKDVPESVQAAFEKRYDEICCEQSRILADVDTTIHELSSLGVAMAVCTNKTTAFSRKILEFLRLAPYFRAIVGPDAAGARKPDPRHLLVTLESTGCAPSDALFVGDMPLDVETARNSGIASAVVPTGSASLERLRAANPDHLLDRFADLLNLVRNGATAPR